MFKRGLSLPGLIAVLLALMVQLGIGATVPRVDPIALAAGAICHADEPAGGNQDTPPNHAPDCLVCPLCAAVHAPAIAVLAAQMVLPAPPVMLVSRPGLPPPSTAPPSAQRPPNQPRAPPVLS
jgi:hypothetical protein